MSILRHVTDIFILLNISNVSAFGEKIGKSNSLGCKSIQCWGKRASWLYYKAFTSYLIGTCNSSIIQSSLLCKSLKPHLISSTDFLQSKSLWRVHCVHTDLCKMCRSFLVCDGIHLEVNPKLLSLASLLPTKINTLRMESKDEEEKKTRQSN